MDINSKIGQTLNKGRLIPRRNCNVRKEINCVCESFVAFRKIKTAMSRIDGCLGNFRYRCTFSN